MSVTGPHGNTITVDYSTADWSARAGSEYVAVSCRLSFAKNEMTKSVLVPVSGNRVPAKRGLIHRDLPQASEQRRTSGGGSAAGAHHTGLSLIAIAVDRGQAG